MARDSQAGKLAVILHADVAGSTHMVQMNEYLAHDRIQDTFRSFADTINKYSGRVLESRGDAILAEFERPSDAVAAALSFQEIHSNYISSVNDDIKPEIRIGISMGEVVVADNTVTGVGVVVAQRVEQLADPGGICITSTVEELLPKRLAFDYVSLGEQQLKGLEAPVRVFRVSQKAGEPIPLPRKDRPASLLPQKRSHISVVTILVLLIIIGAVYWSDINETYDPPSKSSIAILPFENLSDNREQEYFADGMTDDLITEISKIPGLLVISRNSVFSLKSANLSAKQVAEKLGVRYVMQGSVRRANNQVRINVQLIDSETEGNLWAEKYDGSLDSVFSVQDKIARNIVTALSLVLGYQADTPVKTSSTEAYDEYLQGLSFYLRNTPEDNAKAEPHFKRAIELDSGFKHAYAALAKVYYKGIEVEYSHALGIYWRKTSLMAYRNLTKIKDANIADVHVVRAQMALLKHQVNVSLNEANRALTLNSNDVEALKTKAKALIYSGNYQEGRELANQVMQLDPVVIAEPLYVIGLSYFAEGNYEKAIEYVGRASKNDPKTNQYNLLLATSYGKNGMEKKANEAWLRYRKPLRGAPVWIGFVILYFPFRDTEVLNNLADGFEAAGAVERPPSRYYKLDSETRLNGAEIKALLFGQKIKGSDLNSRFAWEQKRSVDGKVSHTGISTHSGFTDVEEVAESWIEDDRLCERWFHPGGDATICSTVFRDVGRGNGNYYLMTDHGPHPFQVTK